MDWKEKQAGVHERLRRMEQSLAAVHQKLNALLARHEQSADIEKGNPQSPLADTLSIIRFAQDFGDVAEIECTEETGSGDYTQRQTLRAIFNGKGQQQLSNKDGDV